MRLLIDVGRTRLIALVLLLAYLPACHSWRTENVAPEQLISTKHPDKVRVRLADSSAVELQQPSIVGDTLRGQHKSGPRAIPLSDVRSVATRQANWVGNGVIIAMGAGLIAGMIAFSATMSNIGP
ncbi:MAG: hypothetical protein ACM3NS_06345 [Deltaproteobacteria bacterium]